MTFNPYRNLKVARCQNDGHPLWFDSNAHTFVCPKCRARYKMYEVINGKGQNKDDYIINRQ